MQSHCPGQKRNFTKVHTIAGRSLHVAERAEIVFKLEFRKPHFTPISFQQLQTLSAVIEPTGGLDNSLKDITCWQCCRLIANLPRLVHN